MSQEANKKIDACGINISHEFPYCLSEQYRIDKGKTNKIYGLTHHFLGKGYSNGSVLLAELDDILLIDDIPMEMTFKNYKIYNSANKTLTAHKSEVDYDFLKVTFTEGGSESNGYKMSEFLADELSMNFKGFHSREGDQKRYLRWSSGNSTIIVFNKTGSLVKKTMSFSLIRPRSKNIGPAIIDISHNDKTTQNKLIDRYIIESTKEMELVFVFVPGVNYIEFKSDSLPIDNGDPRNIVFGIANYRLNDL